MATTYNHLIGFYRPGLSSPERLLKTSVGRRNMLEDLLEKLQRQTGKKKKQHFIFVGPRGIGKTHFLRLLEERVQQSEELNQHYTVIRFPEENHRILSFADFLLGIVEILADITADDQWRELFRQTEELEKDEDIADILLPRLKHYRKASGKNLLILLENLDTLLGEQIKNEKSIHELRKFLMETETATFVGTAPLFFPGFDNVNYPLYDFFDIQVLEELTETQTVNLIRVNLEWEGRKKLLGIFETLIPKIRAIHEMTGGNPRLTMILYEIIANENLLEVSLQFEKLLDQISPFYQDRIKELAPQERALLETMALMRTELKTPAGIAKKLRKSPQQTSALINRMLKSGYLSVSNHPQDKRSKVYLIKEGFFEFWLAMSQSRVQRKYLLHLVEFFEKWYADKQERENKRQELRESLDSSQEKELPIVSEKREELLSYLSEVGTVNEKAQAKLEMLVLQTKVGKKETDKELLQEIGELFLEDPTFIWMKNQAGQWITGEIEPDIRQQMEEMIRLWQCQRNGDLEKMAVLALKLGTDFSDQGLHELNIAFLQERVKEISDTELQLPLLYKLARSQTMLGKLDGALETWQTVLHFAKTNNDQQLLGSALNNIATIFHSRADYDHALEYLTKSLKIRREIGNREGEGATLNNIAQIYSVRGDYDHALEYLKDSLKICREIGDKAGLCATLFSMGHIHWQKKEFETAMSVWLKVYPIAKEIGEYKALNALENLAKQLGGDGLQFWEEKAKKV